MNTAYTSIDELLSQTATTPEELRRKQRLIEQYGGGIEVVAPNSPISAQEFAEAAMCVFEENGYLAQTIEEIDYAMNVAANDLPNKRQFIVAVQYETVFAGHVAFLNDDYEQALDTYMLDHQKNPCHIIDVRTTAQRYIDPDEGFVSSLRSILGLYEEEPPEDARHANKEIAELFAWELGRSLFDYYGTERGFSVILDGDLDFLNNWFGDDLSLRDAFAVGLVLKW